MNDKQYSQLSILYQFITMRFNICQNYDFDRFYKYYDTNLYRVFNENLEVLQLFRNLTLREILTQKRIDKKNYTNAYLDSKLVIIEVNKIYIHLELGVIFFNLLISKFQIGIRNIVSLLKNNYKGIKISDNGDVLKMKVNLYNDFLSKYEKTENFNFIIHLFAKTNSSIITLNWENEIKINLKYINEILEFSKNYNFDCIDL